MTNELPFAIFEIEEYMVIFRQLEEREINGTAIKLRGLIRCTGTGTNDEHDYRLEVFFLAPDSPVPPPSSNIDERLAMLFMPISDMPMIIDILRHEKPVFGHLRADNPQYTSITTTTEPVGEGNFDDDYKARWLNQ